MNLTFEKVLYSDEQKIIEIYDILKCSGEQMFQKHGLVHWRNPYPLEAIIKNCAELEVFIAKDTETNRYVHTFQLDFMLYNCASGTLSLSTDACLETVKINKFSTIPDATGKGIGEKSLEFIADYCRNIGIKKLTLNVYGNSVHSIRFFTNRGFIITGTELTRYFTVFVMEKQIQIPIER